MDDRELLKLAARAAGYKKYYAHHLGRDSFVTYNVEYYSDVKESRVVGEKTLDWNPLKNDGDALRLAVKLRIELKFGGVSTRIPANVAVSYPEKISSASEKQILLVEQYVPDEMFTSVDSRFGESDLRFAEYHVENYGTTIGVMAATRRAIVRAAAEIGRNMK